MRPDADHRVGVAVQSQIALARAESEPVSTRLEPPAHRGSTRTSYARPLRAGRKIFGPLACFAFQEPMKRCSKCGEEKPPTDFRRDPSRKDGRYPQCKACERLWRQENAKKKRAQGRTKDLAVVHLDVDQPDCLLRGMRNPRTEDVSRAGSWSTCLTRHKLPASVWARPGAGGLDVSGTGPAAEAAERSVPLSGHVGDGAAVVALWRAQTAP
jgi:hypothetical protein